MKAATGELNLTLITVVALGALLALFTGFMWPTIKKRLTNAWNSQDTNLTVNNKGNFTYNFDKYIETELF